MPNVAAVIWDLDGTLVDSEALHDASLARVVEHFGETLHGADLETVFGRTLRETHAHLTRSKPGLPPFEPFACRYDVVSDEILSSVTPFADADATLRELAGIGMPMAVATSSRRRRLDITLDACGYADLFRATAAGDEVEHGKPAPDLYLLAAERISESPESCLALEDSQAGVDSALSAGMRVVAVSRDGRAAPTGCPVVAALAWPAIVAALGPDGR